MLQSARQFKGSREIERSMFAEERHHEHALTVLRHAVVLCVEDGIVVGVTVLYQPLTPPAEVIAEFLLRGECLYILHEQELGMLCFNGIGTGPQAGRACSATLGEATLFACRRNVLTGERICKQVKIGCLRPVNLGYVAVVGNDIPVKCTICLDSVLVNLRNSDSVKLEIGERLGKQLKGDRLRAVACKGFKDAEFH